MNTFIRGINLSKKSLKITLLILVALVCATAICLGVVFSNKNELTVTPETDTKVEILDEGALLNANGWNDSIALKLNSNLSKMGDNVALGNAGGQIVSNIISLGGYDWIVVYKQNGIITLYANEAVATLPFDETNNTYSTSAVRDYLVNEFLPQLIKNVGYDEFADMIVPYGVDSLYYQAENAQSVPLMTVNNQDISNSNGIAGDKIWLPSALEVGGFSTTANSPTERVNSFKTIKENGFSINSGLWNLSNNTRLEVNNYALRSSVNDGIAVVNNGIITEGSATGTYAVRPCINLVMPEVSNGVVLEASAPVVTVDGEVYSSPSLLATVTPDYTAELSKYANLSGTTFTAKTGNVDLNGVTMSNSAALLITLSDAVMAGQSMSGYTFNLVEDVDMSVVTVWNPIGRNGSPNAFPFSGTFNGNGYKISGLSSAGSGLVGLFGYIQNATIQNVAVVDSSWYTTTSNVGGIAGTAISSTITACYNESGISGLDYVGGIVGNMSSNSVVSNCYNLHGVAGRSSVGGIVGENNGCNVSTSYSVGAVSATNSSAGAIYGANLNNATYTNCVYYGANQTNTTGITPASSYEQMQGARTNTGVTYDTTLYAGWTFDSNPWFISGVENDRLPMLYIFLKEVTLNVKVNDANAGAIVNIKGGTNHSTVPLNTAITITATANFAGTNHYKLTSWNYYDIMDGGLEVSTDLVYANGGNGTAGSNVYTYTLSFTMNDSYNLEAIFTKLYMLDINAAFSGFSSGYTNSSAISVTASSDAVAGIWYEYGTQVTVQLGTSTLWSFVNFSGSTSNTGGFSAIDINNNNGFVTQSDDGYIFIVGHESYYTNNDAYYVNANFNRMFNIEISVNSPTGSGTVTIPTPVVQMVIGGNPYTSGTETDTGTIVYNGSFTASITNSADFANILNFTNWSITEITGSESTSQNPTYNLSNYGTLADNITDLHLVATFNKVSRTITVNETGGEGKVILTTGTLTDSEVISGAEVTSLPVEYGQNVNIYIYPDYSQGYEYVSFSGALNGGSMGSTGVYSGSFTVLFTDASSPTYTVTYALSNDFEIDFNAYINGTLQTDGITFSQDPATSLNINSSINGYTVTVANGTQYFLESVQAVYNSITKEVISNAKPSDGYQGTNSAQSIFANLGTTQNVAGLISKIGTSAAYNQYNITVNVYFIGITRTITVQEFLTSVAGGDSPVLTTLNKFKITGTGYNEGQGVYLNDYTLTVTAGAGYRVDSITLGDTNGTIPSATWNNSGSLVFTLNDNVTINIYYTMRPYNVTIQDNLSTIGATLRNTYAYSLNGSPAGNYSSTLTLDYGSVIEISGYAVLEETTAEDQTRRAQLQSIVITNGAEATLVTTITDIPNTLSRTLNDEYDNITITFNYILLQKVTVKLQDASTGATTANAAMVILQNVEDTSDRIIVIVAKGEESQEVECQTGAEYNIQAIVPIFISADYSSSDGTGTTQDNVFNITFTGDVTDITIDLATELANNSIYGSIII